MMRTLAISLVLLASSASASDVIPHIPVQFLGTWAGSLEECGALGSDSTLRLESDRVAYWESFGALRAIVANGDDEIAMILDFSGEGEVWLGTLQLSISPDGERLIDEYSVPGEPVVRYRCPSTTAASI